MKEAIRDYFVMAILVVLLVIMIGSCLMMIKNLSIEWFVITLVTTIIGTIISLYKFDDPEDLDEKEQP